ARSGGRCLALSAPVFQPDVQLPGRRRRSSQSAGSMVEDRGRLSDAGSAIHAETLLKTALVAVGLLTYGVMRVYVGHGEARAVLILVAGRNLPFLLIAL